MKILIIEDEITLSNNIATYLESNNYLCEQAFNYQEGIEKISLYEYDCILLDINLPDGVGLDLLKEIRKRQIKIGVIIISARGEITDKIKGLTEGADDYLAKPFSLAELNVRIFALIRRQYESPSNSIESNGIQIDLLAKRVEAGGVELNLTRSEYHLLLFLIGNKNRSISKNTIAEHLSGDMADYLDDVNFIYAHIKNLKAKLAKVGVVNCIKTVYGIGYQWVEV